MFIIAVCVIVLSAPSAANAKAGRSAKGVTAVPEDPSTAELFTCVANPNCRDATPWRCVVYVRNNGCNRNPVIKQFLCQKSCDNCQCKGCADSVLVGNRGCLAKRDYCPFYLELRKACPKTCGACRNLPAPTLPPAVSETTAAPGITSSPDVTTVEAQTGVTMTTVTMGTPATGTTAEQPTSEATTQDPGPGKRKRMLVPAKPPNQAPAAAAAVILPKPPTITAAAPLSSFEQLILAKRKDRPRSAPLNKDTAQPIQTEAASKASRKQQQRDLLLKPALPGQTKNNNNLKSIQNPTSLAMSASDKNFIALISQRNKPKNPLDDRKSSRRRYQKI